MTRLVYRLYLTNVHVEKPSEGDSKKCLHKGRLCVEGLIRAVLAMDIIEELKYCKQIQTIIIKVLFIGVKYVSVFQSEVCKLILSCRHKNPWEAQWLVPWTPDRAVRVRALAGALRCVLGQDT